MEITFTTLSELPLVFLFLLHTCIYCEMGARPVLLLGINGLNFKVNPRQIRVLKITILLIKIHYLVVAQKASNEQQNKCFHA